jgi:hypothetical protein
VTTRLLTRQPAEERQARTKTREKNSRLKRTRCMLEV